MSIPTKLWLYACAAIGIFLMGFGYGHHVASVAAKADAQELALGQAATANQAWAERFTLQAQLATRDQQLADSQAQAAQKRTVVVVQKEIIYRDKIKDTVVRDCVANSGLLDVYDATLGLPNSTELPNDAARCADVDRWKSRSRPSSNEAQRGCSAE